MDRYKLDLMVHKANGLKDVTLFGSMNPYAVVWIAKHDDLKPDRRLSARKTNVAKNGASSTVWNAHMEFNLRSSRNQYTLFCEIVDRGRLFDRKIGEVQVPLSRLRVVGHSIGYPVKILSSGKVMGEIILSHMFSPSVFEYEDGNINTGSQIATADELDVPSDYHWYADEDE